MTKYEYVKQMCESDYNADEKTITNEGIVGSFAGTAFSGENLDNCIKKIIKYLDYENSYLKVYGKKSLVQISLDNCDWNNLE